MCISDNNSYINNVCATRIIYDICIIISADQTMWTSGARTGLSTFIWSATGAAMDNTLFETGHDPSASDNLNKLIYVADPGCGWSGDK